MKIFKSNRTNNYFFYKNGIVYEFDNDLKRFFKTTYKKEILIKMKKINKLPCFINKGLINLK